MKRNILLAAVTFILFGITSYGQGWLGSGQNLYTINSPSFPSVNIGIGTTSPTAQLHTTGTVRFAGITNNNTHSRVMVTDNSGNVFWRDAATIGQSNAWLLTGNAGTNPATNFLGTTDNNRLVFRTFNVERMTVLANGNVGIGLNAPTAPLHVFSNSSDNHAFVSGTSPSLRFFQGAAWTGVGNIGRIGLATITNDFVNTSSPGDFVVQALTTTGNLIFGTSNDNINGLERMRINQIGYTGISTTTPSAKLHVQCSLIPNQTNPSNIRFENLQSGTGDMLVIDNTGYVYRSSMAAFAGNQNLQQVIKELEMTKKEVLDLKLTIEELRQKTIGSKAIDNSADRARLLDGKPNPFSNETIIGYYLPANIKSASIVFTDLSGKAIKSENLTGKTGSGTIRFTAPNIPAGIYLYTLVVDNQVAETKKLIQSAR